MIFGRQASGGVAGYVGASPGSTTFYVPYATPSELRGRDLGVVLNQDRYRVAPREPLAMSGPLGVVLDQDRYIVVPREPMAEYSTGLSTAGASLLPRGSSRGLGLAIMADPTYDGGYPTDMEMRSTYGYLPISNSWHSRAWPWTATDGTKVGLGDPTLLAAAAAAANGNGDPDTFQQLVSVQKRQGRLQLISTVAITTLAVVALVGIFSNKG